MSARGWENWSGRIQCPSSSVHRPADVAELAALIRAQRRDQVAANCVRAIGSGHSFVPFWQDGDLLVRLDAFTGLHAVVEDVALIGAGTPIHVLGPLLAATGRALINQGDIDRQALAGAVATGTHGTGRGLGSLSSAVVQMELVDASGEVRMLESAEHLAAARVSLGLFGVSTRLGMRTVPIYGLHEHNWQEPTEITLDAFEDRLDAHRHHEFWWLPAQDLCIAKTLTQIEVPATAQLAEIPFGERGERWGPCWQVFPSVREARFNELEYAVPAEQGMACFRALRAALLEQFPKLPWPIEYRILAGDDGWLSPTAGREVAAISVHQDARRDPQPLFACAEPILRAFGGRPHWGKCHTLAGPEIRELYPRLDDFHRLRARFDPHDLFLGAWLADTLGARSTA